MVVEQNCKFPSMKSCRPTLPTFIASISVTVIVPAHASMFGVGGDAGFQIFLPTTDVE
jgi:hypothetical protein